MFDYIFILNEESLELVRSGKSEIDFRYALNGCFSSNEKKSEAAIVYEEHVVRKLFDKNGLVINQPVYYGCWCNQEKFLTYQDLIVAEKIGSG